ncbi:MAG: metallophosphoesterase, partial [Nitrospirota bacterium]|nr:metallophosphoesterase [Nitrospirota bacterium]
MRLLFSSFLLIYGLMHAYAFQRARAALQFDLRQGMLLVLFMVVMVLTPFIVRYSEREGLEMFARVMSYGGYLWMGTLLLFVSASFAVDVFRILLYLINSMTSVPIVTVSAKAAFFASLVFSIAAAGYGFFEARDIRLEHVVIRTSKLPAGMNKLKIVQVSDVHLGLIVREERLRKVVDRVKEAGPDLLVSTGDLVDGQINRL